MSGDNVTTPANVPPARPIVVCPHCGVVLVFMRGALPAANEAARPTHQGIMLLLLDQDFCNNTDETGDTPDPASAQP